MWPNSQETNWINWIKLFAVFPANFVTFTEEILNGKLNFCAVLVDSFVIHMHLNSVLVQKKSCVSYGICARYHCTLKMKHRRISAFFCEMQLSFFFDVIFFINREIWFRVIITKQITYFLTSVQFSEVPRKPEYANTPPY